MYQDWWTVRTRGKVRQGSHTFTVTVSAAYPIRDNLITLFDRCVTFVHSLFSKANSPLLGGDAQIFWWLRAASPTHSMKNLTRWLRARWRILPSLCRLHLAPDIEALGVQKKEIYGFSVNCEICSPLLALHPPSLWAISITFKFPVEFGRGGKSLIICHHRRYEESPVQFDSNIL